MNFLDRRYVARREGERRFSEADEERRSSDRRRGERRKRAWLYMLSSEQLACIQVALPTGVVIEKVKCVTFGPICAWMARLTQHGVPSYIYGEGSLDGDRGNGRVIAAVVKHIKLQSGV